MNNVIIIAPQVIVIKRLRHLNKETWNWGVVNVNHKPFESFNKTYFELSDNIYYATSKLLLEESYS
jgi:hypothetical protein